MQTFKVFPKGKGEPFDLKCDRFEIKDKRFILYAEGGAASADGFLAFADVAAVIPEHLQAIDELRPVKFLLYLKGRSEPVDIFAYGFNQNDEPRWTFIEGRFNQMTRTSEERPFNGGVYLDTEEVVAILPSDGLVYRRR